MRIIFILIVLIVSCKPETQINNKTVFSTSDLNKLNRKLLEIAMEDGFPPPVASRVYVYPHIGHYTTLQYFYPDSLSNLVGVLNQLDSLQYPDSTNVNPELAALLSFATIAKKVTFSEHYMESYKDTLLSQSLQRGLSQNVIDASKAFADQISSQILNWASKDNYLETRTMDRYTSVKEPSKWRETPADYMAALEPHWPKIRPLVIDSASIYKAKELPKYSTEKASDFYKMADLVYQTSKSIDSAKIETAWFWDDNPNSSDHKGHSVAIVHKISPPGHWLNIINQISDKNGYNLFTTSEAYTKAAIAMFDGIISCWHVKFETNVVRPISYIQENIDVSWNPLIQTPPFPEYTSGHSVISASAATVLTSLFGDNYIFEDNSTELFGIKGRKFSSFHEAAWEVSLSRFYGGIHYYNGIEEGNKQGKFIGQYILERTK